VNNKAGVYGGVGYFDEAGTWYFERCRFEGNTGQYGGVLGVSDSTLVKVSKGCSFERNSAVYGGALFATSQGEFQVRSSRFQSNSATAHGGVFFSNFLSSSCPHFSDTTFINNEALESGGALFFELDSDKVQSSTNSNGGEYRRCLRELSFCDDGCNFIKNKVTLGYGRDYATSPTAIVQMGPVRDTIYASQTFNTSFEVRDSFNQTLRGFIGNYHT